MSSPHPGADTTPSSICTTVTFTTGSRGENMEPNKGEEGPEQQHSVTRGLDQVSHLFLSHVAERAARGRSRNGSELPAAPPDDQPPNVLLTSRRVNREQLVSLLREQPAALEEGLKVIDVNLP